MKVLFLTMNEYHLWAAPKAADILENRYPGAFEQRVYAVRKVNNDTALASRLLADCDWADFAIVAAHGSIQGLHCFTELWARLAGKKPVFFTTTMADELAELSGQLGLSPEA